MIVCNSLHVFIISFRWIQDWSMLIADFGDQPVVTPRRREWCRRHFTLFILLIVSTTHSCWRWAWHNLRACGFSRVISNMLAPHFCPSVSRTRMSVVAVENLQRLAGCVFAAGRRLHFDYSVLQIKQWLNKITAFISLRIYSARHSVNQHCLPHMCWMCSSYAAVA